jgi:hypothetical protein
VTWTTEQILALAPDASAAKAARGLATPRPWVSLGQNEQAAWGECQGSGARPYQTQVELAEPAFKCSCPSRKLPCKHGLGLLLLRAGQTTALPQTEPPQWVTTWLAGRAQRAQQRSDKVERPTPALSPAAQARRVAGREAKVAAGLDELDQWLNDLARRGLASVQAERTRFWEGPAARLVDAQAPGLARRVREMAGVPASGDGWPERLLEQLGRLHLAVEGYRRIDTLPPAVQADLRTVVGWTQSQEELLVEPSLRDEWLVLGQRVEPEERLRVQRTWLWGRQSQRPALLLHFAHGNQAFEFSLPGGVAIDAEVVFYPSAYPLRALIKQRHGAPTPIDGLAGYPTIASATAAYAAALAAYPWLDEFPLTLTAALPVRMGSGWAVRDTAGQVLPLAPRFDQGWRLLALSGGHPLALFGEWNGDHLLPLSTWADGTFTPF